MRVILVVLAVLLFLSLTRLLSSDGGLGEYLSLKHRVSELEQQIEKQQAENTLLIEEVKDLQQGQNAVETIARQQLGMVEEGEVFIKLLELKPSNIVAPPPEVSSEPVLENPQPINKID